MSWFNFFAIFFVVWWGVLFVALPFGLRTQQDENDVTLGTVASAPRGPHMRKTLLWTTIVALVLMALYVFATVRLGWSLDHLPQIIPNYQ